MSLAIGTGCASSPASNESRIQALAAREFALRRSINGLEEDRAVLVASIAASRKEADVARCRAEAARLDAEASVREAAQIGERARYLGCVAKNTKESSGFSAIMCLAGTVITGGAGLALCGGSLLVGDSATEACGLEPPQPDRVEIRRSLLLERGLADPETCGDQVPEVAPQ